MSTLIQTAEKSATFNMPKLADAYLIEKPKDVPKDWIAYNPSAIWTVDEGGHRYDIIYLRVEPNHSGKDSSHLGKTVVRPYIIDLAHPEIPLRPYYDGMEFKGEDPALTRIKRRLANGALENIWLLSCVVPEPKIDKPNEVASLETRFYAGPSLSELEYVGVGPKGMKDIRETLMYPDETTLGSYGRPQTEPDSGNITYRTLKDYTYLTPEVIADAPYIDENLFPIGSGKWGGVGEPIRIDTHKTLLLSHQAQYTDSKHFAKCYEAISLGHDLFSNTVVNLGVFATSSMFHSIGDSENIEVKDDETTDLRKVVFTGGGRNGKLTHVTFGVSDARIGIGRLL